MDSHLRKFNRRWPRKGREGRISKAQADARRDFCSGIVETLVARGVPDAKTWDGEQVLAHLLKRSVAHAARRFPGAHALIDQPDGDSSDDNNDEEEEGAHHPTGIEPCEFPWQRTNTSFSLARERCVIWQRRVLASAHVMRRTLPTPMSTSLLDGMWSAPPPASLMAAGAGVSLTTVPTVRRPRGVLQSSMYSYLLLLPCMYSYYLVCVVICTLTT